MSSILLDPLDAGALEARGPRPTDSGSAAVVLVVGGDVADRCVQPDAVVLTADAVKLGVEGGRVGESGEVRPVALEVAEEALDVRLVSRCRLRLMGSVMSEPFV